MLDDVNFGNFSDEQLIEMLAERTMVAQSNEADAKQIKAELLQRQRASGEMSISHAGWRSGLKREPFSLTWFKRETGYEKADLPPECFTEKISIEPDWERVNAWMQEHHGHELPTTYALTFQREKAA